jgi:glycerophosphoryl diester phosphodiesterase
MYNTMEEDKISWKAIYDGGESLSQFNLDGRENKYTDIDRKKITQFVLYRDKTPVVVIHLGGKKRLIYRMRRALDNHGNQEAVYLAGWQEKRNGTNIQSIVFLFEDGHVEILDRFYEKNLWFYAINFLPDERL